jgi:hypothetical protein
MDDKDTRGVIVDWINLAQDRSYWWAFVNSLINLKLFFNSGIFSASRVANCQRRYAPWSKLYYRECPFYRVPEPMLRYTIALLLRNPAFAGTSRDSCLSQGQEKRGALSLHKNVVMKIMDFSHKEENHAFYSLRVCRSSVVREVTSNGLLWYKNITCMGVIINVIYSIFMENLATWNLEEKWDFNENTTMSNTDCKVRR